VFTCLLCLLRSSDESDAAWDDGLPLADNLESNLTLVGSRLLFPKAQHPPSLV